MALSPDEMRPSWTNYVNVLLDYNRDAYAAFEAAGYGDIDVALILISDADANDMLFSSENGSIVYSALAPDVASTLPDAEELQPIVDWLQTAEVRGAMTEIPTNEQKLRMKSYNSLPPTSTTA